MRNDKRKGQACFTLQYLLFYRLFIEYYVAWQTSYADIFQNLIYSKFMLKFSKV